jgi:AraC-like DNA-binding protein
MTITFTESDWDELWDDAQSPASPAELDSFETLEYLPNCVGSGYSRSFDLVPGMWLILSDWHCDREFVIPSLEQRDHPIQIFILLCGISEAEGVHPMLGGKRGYFSGSGISPGFSDRIYGNQRLMTLNIEIEPELLDPLFGEDTELRSILCRGSEWKNSFYPTVTTAMKSIARQIWKMPYHGAARRMYLQAKAWELLATQIDLVSADRFLSTPVPQLRAQTIDRLHYAKQILTDRWEQPPLLSDLAQEVGISDCTLRRGFRELFETSPIQYLTKQRMRQAKQLLDSQQWTVAEVARMVGYGNLGHFAAAFKREFGLKPSDCLDKQSKL